jgi:hypothetical protein
LLRIGNKALLPCHGTGLVGQWAWLAGRVAGRSKKEKTKAFIFPCCTSRGRRRTLFFNMKRRRFGQNAPFHLNKTRRQNASNFKSLLNYLLFISIASLSISVSAPIVGRVFHFSPWPLIYAIGPSIDQ